MVATRWGILGASKIAKDFIIALKTLPETDHEVVAIAARSLERAEAIAKHHGVGCAYGSYEELVKDPRVQIAYVASIHPQHVHLAKLALNNGKHVLCEKPMTMNSLEAEEVLTLAKEKGLFFMEGLWTCFFPLYKEVLQKIQSKEIGEVQFVLISFGHGGMLEIERVRNPDLGGGAMLDLGVYPLLVSDLIFEGEEPEKIAAVGHKTDQGSDETVSATLLYSRNRMCQILVSIGASRHLPNEVQILGTKGSMKIHAPFHCSTRVTTPSGDMEFPIPEIPTHFPNQTGMRFELQAVRENLLAGELENKIATHERSRRLMKWIDEIRRQVGVVYPQEKV